jgi:hypothetical protein
MYSRYPKSSQSPIHIPEHYNGCAFSDTSIPETPSSPTKEAPPSPTPLEINTQKSFSSLFNPFGGSFGLLRGGLGFEELLLIGLILLLSHSEQENDTILWLALLLFCK